MDAHAWKRHVSTMRANVYVVSDWCGVRSFDPCVRFRAGHVFMLVVRILLLLSVLLLLYSMGRDGGVYRLWVSASSCAYRRVFLGAGPCDVYRTVFCPTLSSLSVRTYSARVSASPPPAAILR